MVEGRLLQEVHVSTSTPVVTAPVDSRSAPASDRLAGRPGRWRTDRTSYVSGSRAAGASFPSQRGREQSGQDPGDASARKTWATSASPFSKPPGSGAPRFVDTDVKAAH